MFTGVQRPVLKFSEICTFSVLYKAYLAARRGKRSRAATANYEVHLLANIVNLVYILQTKIYRPGLFRVFYVYEPKKTLTTTSSRKSSKGWTLSPSFLTCCVPT